jgi:hypothetical protein
MELLAEHFRPRIISHSQNAASAAKQAQLRETIGRFNGERTVPFIVAGALAAAFGFLALGMTQVGGQTIPKSLQEGGPDEFIKQRKNNWTVGLVGGAFDGGYLRLADELGKVVDDGDQLRVIPVITHGAAGNLKDLLYPALPLPGAFWRAT